MRVLPAAQLVERIRELALEANRVLPGPVLRALKEGRDREPMPLARSVLEDLLAYGFYSGLGQWRNGGWGNFRYELVRES